MRSEQEMMELILGTAREDERIRAVWMNGSRTNIHAPVDIFQDYDIVYLVTDVAPFENDPSWLDRFGERLIMQLPDRVDQEMGIPAEEEDRFVALMQFADGNRIDLSLVPLSRREDILKDKLVKVLLDKDGVLPAVPTATDEDYWVKKPTAGFYFGCCNEFLWTACYVAKGLWREEFLYAQFHIDRCVREELIRMLTWEAGVRCDFKASAGKCGKYLKNFLPGKTMERLTATYDSGGIEQTWESLLLCMELFRESAGFVADALGFRFGAAEWERVQKYLCHVRSLPKDAAGIF